MKYLKVFTDFAEVIAPLGDAEAGRLFKAMLEYAETGTEPDFRGNERFVWPAAKQNIDRTEAFNEKQRENGALGGRPRKSENPTKPKITQNNPKKPNKSLKDKDKDKENISSLRSEINPPPPPLGGEEEQKCADETKLDAAIAAFVEFRKGVKKPMTDYAVKLLREKLDKMAASEEEKVAIIEQSIVNGWQGVFPLKDAQQTGGNVFLDIAREEGIL